MKTKLSLFLSPLLIAAAACSYQAMQPISPAETAAEQPMHPSHAIAVSGQNDTVSWQCHQEDVNDNLVWIECDFQNRSTAQAFACVQVIILDSKENEVDRSRSVCSNAMPPNGSYQNYAAFENSKRSQRRTVIAEKCGKDTSFCSIRTEERKP